MTDPNNFIDMASTMRFHKICIAVHLDWLQSCTDLSGMEGFQSHNIAVRHCLMSQQSEAVTVESVTTNRAGFSDHRKSLEMPNDNKSRDLQNKKLELFLQQAKLFLHKHCSRWLEPSLLPAALLSEMPLARVIADVVLQKQPTFTQTNQAFNSTIHGGNTIDSNSFHQFVESHVGNSNAECEREAVKFAEMMCAGMDIPSRLEANKELLMDDDEHDLLMHTLSKCLRLVSHTQFVEFGVKEAKLVSDTNCSEEMRSCCAIVRCTAIRSCEQQRQLEKRHEQPRQDCHLDQRSMFCHGRPHCLARPR